MLRPPLLSLASLLFLLAAPLARADGYVVSITGGHWTSSGNYPTATQAYATQGGATLGGGCPTGGDDDSDHSVMPAGTGSASCNGALHAVLHWDGDRDRRPKTLIVKETALAEWSGDPGGACDTSLSGANAHTTVTTTAHGQRKESVRYTVIYDPDVDVPIDASPSASASLASNVGTVGPGGGDGDEPSPTLASGSVRVIYAVVATPVTIESDFAVRVGDSRNFLVGQGADFYVSAGGYSQDPGDGVWSMGMDFIDDVIFVPETVITGFSARQTLSGNGQPTGSHPLIYFEGEGRRQEIDCFATLNDGNYSISVFVSREFLIYRPSVAHMEPGSDPLPTIHDKDSSSRTDDEYAAAQDYGHIYSGFGIDGHVELPSVFDPQGSGQWSYVQLCATESQRDSDPAITEPRGLDNTYPYMASYTDNITFTSSVWPSTPSSLYFYDAPGLRITDRDSYRHTFHGDCYMVLRPCHFQNQPVVELPLACVRWDYQSSSTRDVTIRWKDAGAYRPATFSSGGGFVTDPTSKSFHHGLQENPIESKDMDWTSVVHNR